MKVRINWSELGPALLGLGYQVIFVVLLAVLMPHLHATADEVIAVVVVCIAVIGAQAAIHLIAAYVRMSLLLNRVAPGSGQPKSALANCSPRWRRTRGRAGSCAAKTLAVVSCNRQAIRRPNSPTSASPSRSPRGGSS